MSRDPSTPLDRHATVAKPLFVPGEDGRRLPLKVAVVAGIDEGTEVPLESAVEVGTDPSANLVLRDPAISRRHLRITLEGAALLVKDLGSRNGTMYGGARVHAIEVPLGAVIGLGNSELAIQPRWHVREVGPSHARAFGELYGESVAMREVFSILERAAPTDTTVLIEGESGTGKELAARSIHAASTRSSGPYVVFDCGAIPPNLAESELLGHVSGAFSGAARDRAGAFERAHGGTLCLDELGELPLELQSKLLRVLETGEVTPIGSDTARAVDVRVIASTNRDLHAESKRGRFRADLYYRLEVVRVRMPPLRRRPEDIPGLVQRLLAGKLQGDAKIEGKNLRKLVAYAWPGNVRELRNALSRAVTLASEPSFDKLVFNLGPVGSAPLTLGAELPGISTSVPYKEAKEQLLEVFDRAYVSTLLDRHRGNVTQAAAAAGLSRKHLHDLIKKLELT